MLYTRFDTLNIVEFLQEAQLRDQEREVALKEAEEESRLQEQVPKSMGMRIERIHFYICQVEEAKRRSEQEAREAEEKEKARQVGDKGLQNKIKINPFERFVKQSRPFPLSLLSTVALPWQTSGRKHSIFGKCKNKTCKHQVGIEAFSILRNETNRTSI